VGEAGPGRLRHRVGEGIRRDGLWAAGDRVTVAVSGGLDAMVLLDVLRETERWHRGRVEAVTVDHGLRPESSADAAFVWDWCRARGVPVRWVALGLGRASEAAARAARYSAYGEGVVAIGHHRDDLAETVILALLRGTGHGPPMRPRNGRFVRPLLGTPRADLRRWAEWRGLAWREDPTNRDPARLRNRIRHEVLPLLESVRPGAGAAIARAVTVADRRCPGGGMAADESGV
jgi:tRNA(Ile)-lysidine synthase